MDAALAAALVAVVLALTGAYVSAERTFYYWDLGAYHDIARQAAAAFRQSAGSGLHFLQESYPGDYNALFALPLLPWLLAFGDSRLVFELAIALIYLVPLPLAIGALALRLAPAGGRTTFWLAAGLTLLVPMTWVPTLRGFPDAGAATLVVLATAFFLDEPLLRGVRAPLRVGVLLGLAVVFRRHFAYAAVAFVLAMVAHALLERLRAGRAGPLGGWTVDLARRVLLVGGIALATALVVAPAFVRRIVEHGYFLSLYRSYEQPLAVLASYYPRYYGWATLLLAGAGFVLAALSPRVVRRRVAFVLLFAGLSWVLWWLLVRQDGDQYTLHFTPTIVLGLCLLLVAPPPGRWRGLRPAAAALVLASSAANLALGLAGVFPVPRAVWPLVMEPRPPLVRRDYDTVLDLVRAVGAERGEEPGLFVASSSECLNASVVSAAERVRSGGRGGLGLLPVPSVDSEGFYPMNELLAARQVLLARPFQYHLPPREQAILGTVYGTFAAGIGLARDFEESPHAFPLADCSVSVFTRRRPTEPATALAMLRAFEQRVPRRPGTQPEWVPIDRRFPTWVSRNADGSTALVAHPSPRGTTPSTAFTALGPLGGPVHLRGTIRFTDALCAGATIRFWTGGVERPREGPLEISRRPEDDGRFEARVAARPGDRLFLDLVEYAPGASIDFCLLEVDPLVLGRAAPDARR